MHPRTHLRIRKTSLGACLAFITIGSAVANPSGTTNAPIQAFTQKYCIDCHGPVDDGPEADFSLVTLLESSVDEVALKSWQKTLQAIDGYEMPPDYMEQPSTKERQQALAAIRQFLLANEGGDRPGRAEPRRLTRLEYNNTVRDLLGLRTDVFMFSERLPFEKSYFEPSARKLPEELRMPGREYGAKYQVLLPESGLPPDGRAEHGFSNRGDAQDFSASALENYIRLAGEIAFHPDLTDAAARATELFPNAKHRTPSRTNHRRDDDGRIKLQIVAAADRVAPNNNVRRAAAESAFRIEEFNRRLHKAFLDDRGGVETFEHLTSSNVAADAVSLQVAYGHNANRVVALVPNSELWAVGFSSAEETSGNRLLANKDQGNKAFGITFQRPGSEDWKGPVEVGLVLLSRKGQAGTVLVTARLSEGRDQSVAVDLAEGTGTDNTFICFRAPTGSGIQSVHFDGAQYGGPYLLIDDMAFIVDDESASEVSGRELAESLPIEPQLDSPEGDSQSSQQDVSDLSPHERLARFMRRAYRRPVQQDEVDRHFALYQSALQEREDGEYAMRAALQSVLSSPYFLYLVHIGDPATQSSGGVRQLTDHELASRLSYFLWSSMPDDELLELADSGRLSKPEVLLQQVGRMLRDQKVRELSESFCVEWLRLRELWSSQPDEQKYREFYTGPMGKRTSARDLFGEALLVFETVLIEDRPLHELLHSDYTYVNGRVAKLYDLKSDGLTLHDSGAPVSKEALANDEIWHRVRLSDPRRGGVLTLGATLTLTSFPDRTSPIKRGAWFLETILNRPPPPPTIAVPDIGEQDIEGKKITLREQVELHRADAACAVCHNRIDPPGLVFENFDAIGRWRERDGTEPVDSSGSIAWLGEFSGPSEFKKLLLADQDRFVRGFIEHLLSYALSRKLEHFDLATVGAIQRQAATNEYRLSEIIGAIVCSRAFQFTERP